MTNNMSYWKEVWERKGNSSAETLEEFDGYEDTCTNVKEIAQHIIKELEITENDTVLEVVN